MYLLRDNIVVSRNSSYTVLMTYLTLKCFYLEIHLCGVTFAVVASLSIGFPLPSLFQEEEELQVFFFS